MHPSDLPTRNTEPMPDRAERTSKYPALITALIEQEREVDGLIDVLRMFEDTLDPFLAPERTSPDQARLDEDPEPAAEATQHARRIAARIGSVSRRLAILSDRIRG